MEIGKMRNRHDRRYFREYFTKKIIAINKYYYLTKKGYTTIR